MKSSIVRRSVVINGRKTSISLEGQFWKGLEDIANDRHQSMSQLITSVNARRRRRHGNLSSATRLFVLDYYRRELDIADRIRAKFFEQTLRLF